MKKKPPQPAPTPKPAPPAKQAAPPAATPAPKAGGDEKKRTDAPTPVPGNQGTDMTQVPVKAADKPPDTKPSDTPDPENKTTKSTVVVPADPIDWFAMRQPFLNRGVSLTTRDGDELQRNFTTVYNQYLGLGLGPDLSLKITNFQLPIYYDLALKRDGYLTVPEKVEADVDKMLGPGKSLGTVVVPIVTPDTLNWAVKKISGKDIDFRF